MYRCYPKVINGKVFVIECGSYWILQSRCQQVQKHYKRRFRDHCGKILEFFNLATANQFCIARNGLMNL